MTGLLVFDGDCGFCSSCVGFVERRLPIQLQIVAWQDADLDALGVRRSDAVRAVQWVGSDGCVAQGAAAVARLLKSCDGSGWRCLGAFMLLPPFSWLAEGAYRVVARYRHRLPGGSPACAAPRTEVTDSAG